ncbi:MAG TPA: hypothetical protein VGT79_11275 [Xanthomonadaceae bacterium]|nr:hypothetical protein [Xanthomonadaceae bacterium]
MNTDHAVLNTHPSQKTPSARNRSQSRTPHRQRDFGVGYGNSSGYASANPRRYADSWAKQPFSCW